MSKPSTAIETAQSLLKEIGHEPLLAYFGKRLQVGKDLTSRPLLITAFAQLTGSQSSVLLSQIAGDPIERLEVRVAAVKALGRLAKQLSETSEQSVLTQSLIDLLGDDNVEVRSASAIQLTDLNPSGVPQLLQKLNEIDELDILAREEVQKFLISVTAPSADYLPHLPARPLVGRQAELQYLYDAFTKSQIVSLVGIPGIGKTALATQFANQSNYDVKIWRSCRNSPDLAYLATDILRTLQVNSVSSRFDPMEVERLIAHLLLNRSTLLVLDDFETIQESIEINSFIEDLIALVPQLNCLIVSRVIPQLKFAKVIKLQGLNSADSLELLRYVAKDRNIDVYLAERTLQLAEGNPLILNLFASYLSSGHPFDEARIGQEAISSIIGKSLKLLSKSERRALEILSQFEEPIPVGDSSLNEIFLNEQIGPLSQVLQPLIQKSLVEITLEERVVIQSLIREFISRQTDQRTILRINRALGQYYQERGNIIRAATHFVRAEMNAKAVMLISEHSIDIINQGHVSIGLRLLNSEVLRTELESTKRMQLFTSVGDFSEVLAQYEPAIESYKKALEIAQNLADNTNLVLLFNKLGLVHTDIGEYPIAINYLLQGLEIAKRTGTGIEISSLLANLGSIEADLGNLESAEQYFQEGLLLSRKNGSINEISIALKNLGYVAEIRGDFSKAEMYLKEALELARQINYRREIVQILTRLGSLAIESKKFRLATDYLQEGLMLAKDLENKETIAYSLMYLGEVALNSGDLTLAERYTSEALSVAQEMEHRALILRVLNQSGTILFQQNHLSQAKKMFLESLRLAEEVGFREISAEDYYGLARVAGAEGNLIEARVLAQKSLELFESLGHYRASNLKEWIEKFNHE